MLESRDLGYSMIELMMVMGISGVVAAIAIPMMGNTIGNYRLSGDAASLRNAISLTKLRAASDFSKSRLYIDISTNSFHIETWKGTTNTWVTEGGTTALSSYAESYSYSPVLTPPANTQGAIGQAPQCLTAAGAATANTACIVFNSRGIPVTDAVGSTGGPTNADAIYLTDGTAVYGITVGSTSVTQMWRTKPTSTPSWVLQ